MARVSTGGGKVLRERVLAMKTIWTKDEPSFHGEFVNFDRLWSYPKPVQKPHPPIIMGSIKPQGLQRIVDYCDGWCPADMAIEDFRRVMAELQERCKRAGRDPRSLSIFAAGDPEESKLHRYRELGIERVVLGVGRADVDVKERCCVSGSLRAAHPETCLTPVSRWNVSVSILTRPYRSSSSSDGFHQRGIHTKPPRTFQRYHHHDFHP